ncbi:hypothetical protein RIF29_40901 [Crotalaria pallida]|uniref:Uncharacterized protein n=1 Tax=Crotalaria pallida TaxID=3830 RepID=A0AAN9HR12_CROPI
MGYRYKVLRADEQQQRSKAMPGDQFRFAVTDRTIPSPDLQTEWVDFMYTDPQSFLPTCRYILQFISSNNPRYSNTLPPDNQTIQDSVLSVIQQPFQFDHSLGSSLDDDFDADSHLHPKKFRLSLSYTSVIMAAQCFAIMFFPNNAF